MEWLEKCKTIDFDRLESLVSERISTLKIVVEKAEETPVYDAICRDLIMPCVGLLAQFVDCVQISESGK